MYYVSACPVPMFFPVESQQMTEDYHSLVIVIHHPKIGGIN